MRIGPIVIEIELAKRAEWRRKALEEANKISDRSNIIKNKMLGKLLHENFIMREMLRGGVQRPDAPSRRGENCSPVSRQIFSPKTNGIKSLETP
jgi:hypothetical protein